MPRLPPPRLTPRLVWSLLGETFVEWYDDRAPRLLLGKEAAQGRAAIESARNAGSSLVATTLGVITLPSPRR